MRDLGLLHSIAVAAALSAGRDTFPGDEYSKAQAKRDDEARRARERTAEIEQGAESRQVRRARERKAMKGESNG